MAERHSVPLPHQWSEHVKSGVLHAISLASVVAAVARRNATARRRLEAELEQARGEIALLREELDIKDGRWQRSRSRRRPHYTPVQRMRILQLRAARGWALEKTARIFLLDLHTLHLWMRRVDEQGESALIQTVEPVNRYPDFVRNVVRQLKRLFPAMGSKRLAQILARIGLYLAATTIRRIWREPHGPSDQTADTAPRLRRRAVGRHAGDVWHVDLTTMPTRAGFWVPWTPFSLLQSWPFCWWVGVVVDQVSRSLVAFAVFRSSPTSKQVQTWLNRAICTQGFKPRCIVTDKGPQFKARSFRRWCRRRKTRRRFGFLGEPYSIPVVERFIRSMKQECLRRLLLAPLTLAAVSRELGCYASWYNEHRPHTTLGGRTPGEIWRGRIRRRRRIETRARWPHQPRGQSPGQTVALDVSYVAGRKHLPVIGLRRAA